MIPGVMLAGVNGKVMGLRSMHVLNGLPDPLMQKPRFWLAMKGLKRVEPETARKFPVTVEMLRNMSKTLAPVGADGRPPRDRKPALGSYKNDTAIEHPWPRQPGTSPSVSHSTPTRPSGRWKSAE